MAGRSPNNHTSKTFETFPKFSKLTLADKDKYEALISGYPPIAEISFASLMQWWNHFDSSAISLLNGNIVVSYWLPGDEQRSGLSLIGTHHIDESICTIFDYQQLRYEQPRLVHVPEFVMSYIEHPEMFSFEGERTLDEYIVSLSSFYPLSHMVSFRRHRVRKFLGRVDEEDVCIRSLDLKHDENKRLLLNAASEWPQKGTINKASKLSSEAMSVSLEEAEALGTESLCIFIREKLHAFILYSLPSDKRYAILLQAKISYELPYLFDYMLYAFSQWFTEQGIIYVNLDVDFGVPMLRMVKLALGPNNFFRKYTITPSASK